MKKILFLLLIPFYSFSQICPTVVLYDNIEVYTWLSGWSLGPNTGYYTNAFVSSTASAAIIGAGSGSSAIESGYYVLPNVTGLNPSYNYILSFRLGSYRFTSTGATSGVDVPDYIDVQLSTNGGVSYVSELRVTGNNNAYWTYASTASASKTANGLLTTFTPTAGGDRTLTGDGYSNIQLTLPTGLSQCAFYIYCRVNSLGEEWWIDNIVLTEQTLCSPLPIELLSFDAYMVDTTVNIKWSTATETNCDYFILERSVNGIIWKEIDRLDGNGTTTTIHFYNTIDLNAPYGYSYYRLKQLDYNGQFEIFPIKSMYKPFKKRNVKMMVNILGQQINDLNEFKGVFFIIYDDGSTEKRVKN
jgi:hypothetical protein